MEVPHKPYKKEVEHKGLLEAMEGEEDVAVFMRVFITGFI